MTNPEQPLRLPRMGHGVRWSDVAAEIEADQAAETEPTSNPDEAA